MIETNTKYNNIILKSAAFLFILGLLTGIYVTMIATGQIEGSLSASLAAHLNGIIGALIILSLILILPHIKYSEKYKKIMIWSFVISNFANWNITIVKSLFNVDGIELIANATANNVIHISLVLFVVIPSLIGAGMWVFGMRKSVKVDYGK